MGRANPTLRTLVRVQRILQAETQPISRYTLHQRLRSSVNYPVLHEVIAFFASHRLVEDHGVGGTVAWNAVRPPLRKLKRARKPAPSSAGRPRP